MSMPQSTRTTQPFRVLLSCLGLLKGQGTGARPNTLLCTDCSLPGVSPRRATQSAHPGLLPDLSESPKIVTWTFFTNLNIKYFRNECAIYDAINQLFSFTTFNIFH